MSIKVVCGCGSCMLLPSEWAGKRAKCKCGRSFVVPGGEASLPAPVAPPAAAHPQPPPAAHVPPPAPEPPAAAAAEPPVSPAPPAPAAEHARLERPASVADTLHRGMHTSHVRPQATLAFITILLALISISAAVLVLRDHHWSIVALLGLDAPAEPPAAPDSSDEDHASSEAGSAGNGKATATAGRKPSAPKAGKSGEASAARLANLTDLVSDDGLLLTGLFGDGVERLALSAPQQETVAGVVTRLHENEEALKAKSITLEQWYAAAHKLGDELLAVLTDAQRQQFQVMLGRKELQRVHLVEYAARFVPELAVAQMPWSQQIAGRSFRVIAATAFTATGDRCCRPSEPTGMLATLARASAADAPAKLTVWDLVKNQQASSVETAAPVADDTCLLSRDGRHCVLTRAGENAAVRVELWSTESGKMVDSKELPAASGAPYAVRDCVVHRVIALGGKSYWVWDFEAGNAQEIEFPESPPDAAPCLAVSADGKHLVVAHPHLIGTAPDERCVIEVCIYRLETGELLGNQVFHKDYLRSTISAIALSHDGRELALLWDCGPDNPARRLVHMNARNGSIIKIVDELPAADQGYARQHKLADRDLVWLPENAGWVVNLQSVVDAETGAVLPLELPAKLNAGAGGATSEIVEVLPAGDGRLLLIIADRPADADKKATMSAQFIDLPKLGPFQ
jgi:hypothetical protein